MRFIPKALKLAPLAATVALAFSASGALAQEVLKIGLTAPLSGGAALYGKNVLNGLNLAAKEINAQGLTVGGKKYTVEIVALDDKYSPAEAAINARRLKQQHETAVIYVPHSGGAFALQAFNQQENFLLMAYQRAHHHGKGQQADDAHPAELHDLHRPLHPLPDEEGQEAGHGAG